MDDVQQHGQAEAVRLVDERLEVVGRAVPGGRREEVRHLIAEGRVVRVLHDRHQLHGVVAVALDAREHVAHELEVGAHALLLGRHAHMRLVDERRHVLLRAELLVRPRKGLARIPDGRAEAVGRLVLRDVGCIERDAVLGAARAGDAYLHLGEVAQRAHAGDVNFPVAVAQAGHRMALAVPVVEIADQMHGRGAGRPLAVNPAALLLVEAIIEVAAGKIGQGLPGRKQLLLSGLIALHARVQIALIRGKARIIEQNFQSGFALFHRFFHKKAPSRRWSSFPLIVPYFPVIFNSFLAHLRAASTKTRFFSRVSASMR